MEKLFTIIININRKEIVTGPMIESEADSFLEDRLGMTKTGLNLWEKQAPPDIYKTTARLVPFYPPDNLPETEMFSQETLDLLGEMENGSLE